MTRARAGVAVALAISLATSGAGAELVRSPATRAFRRELADAVPHPPGGDALARRPVDPLYGLHAGSSGIVLAATGLAMVLTLPLAGARILAAAPDPALPSPAAPSPRTPADNALTTASARGPLVVARSGATFATGVVLALGGTFATVTSGVLSPIASTGQSEQTVVAFAVCGAAALLASVPLLMVSLAGANGAERVRARLDVSPTMVGVSGSF